MLNKAFIDLKKLKRNAFNVKAKLGKTELCAVVKADAYGHGAAVVANAVYDVCDSYAVALAEEGLALRQSGIDKDILLLLSPFASDVADCVRSDITMTVQQKDDAAIIERECKRQSKGAKVHVKYDTGMHRQGVNGLKDLNALLSHIETDCPHIYFEGLYSHFYNPSDKTAVSRQLAEFKLAKRLAGSYNNKVKCHISASGGFCQGIKGDMVRIGILLYGYKPFPTDFIEVEPIMEVYAPVIKTRLIKEKEHLLYGNFTADRDIKISLIRYGYADGLSRNSGELNNRCMDISAVKGTDEGYYPVLCGNADEMAKVQGTISYEILCNVARRAEKIYLR